jgi:hypothetical protein
MKKILSLICIIVLLFSCSKTKTGTTLTSNNNSDTSHNNSNNNDSTGSARSYVSSVKYYYISARVLDIDSFVYNSSKRMTRLLQYELDSSGTPIIDSVTIDFSYSGTDTIPSSYILSYDNYNSDHRLLRYDVLGRIIQDTSITVTGYNLTYTYSGNNIMYHLTPDGTIYNNQIDTFFVSNNDVSKNNQYEAPYDSTSNVYGYSSYANPTYIPNYGALFYMLTSNFGDGFGNIEDFISKDQLNTETDYDDGIFQRTTNPAITLDAKGRVAQYTIPDQKAVYTYY